MQAASMSANISDLELTNLPITQITVSVTLPLMDDLYANLPTDATLTLLGDGVEDIPLETHSILLMTNGDLQEVHMDFNLPSHLINLIKSVRLKKRAGIINDVDGMRLSCVGFSPRAKIGIGYAVLRINELQKGFWTRRPIAPDSSTVKRVVDICHKRVSKIDTNGFPK